MKKVIKLTESDLENIIQKVLTEKTMGEVPGEHPLCKVKCKKKVLGKGNVGVDVKMVQSALSKCGFNKEKEGGGMNAGCGKDYKKCDGKFDVETQKAVREFQKDRGITIDGLVGPRTLEELQKVKTRVWHLSNVTVNKKQEETKRVLFPAQVLFPLQEIRFQ